MSFAQKVNDWTIALIFFGLVVLVGLFLSGDRKVEEKLRSIFSEKIGLDLRVRGERKVWGCKGLVKIFSWYRW